MISIYESLVNFIRLEVIQMHSYVMLFLDTQLDFLLRSLFLAAVLILIFRGLRLVVLKRLKDLCARTKHYWYERFTTAVYEISPWNWRLLSVYVTGLLMVFPNAVMQALACLLIVAFFWQAAQVVYILIELFLGDTENNGNETTIHGVKLLVRVLLWCLAVVMILANLGFDILGLVTSLGIVGVAVALAVQNILGDLFSSFTIYCDKPFKVGDFVVFGDECGTVKEIGLKTTRIQTLQGEGLVISNQLLTNGQLKNFAVMNTRRVSFTLRIDLHTPSEKVGIIDDVVEKAVLSQGKTEFGYGNFMGFEEWFLKFDFAYTIHSSSWGEYVGIHEKVNIEIMKGLEKAGIHLAIPARAVFMSQDS